MPKPIERPPIVIASISMCVCSVSPSGISSSVISPIVTPGSAVIRRLSTSIERMFGLWDHYLRTFLSSTTFTGSTAFCSTVAASVAVSVAASRTSLLCCSEALRTQPA